MQTRAQAKEAAALAAAAQAVVQQSGPPSPPPANRAIIEWAAGASFASTLSDLTPTSSFVSDAGTVRSDSRSLSIINEEGEDEDDRCSNTVAAAARAFGVPQTNPASRALRTPYQSQADYYPPEVFETPRKHTRPPTDEERQAAALARDTEIARSGGLAQLTRTGTLLVPPDASLDPEDDSERTGSGLGSAFTSPSSSRIFKRTTASPSKKGRQSGGLRGLQGAATIAINLETGEFED